MPVVVKASYFPNWQASGADGPWRVTPNEMVVIPTSKHVSLHYGTTPVDYLANAATLLGIAGLGVLWWFGRRRSPDGDNDALTPPPAEEAMTSPSGVTEAEADWLQGTSRRLHARHVILGP